MARVFLSCLALLMGACSAAAADFSSLAQPGATAIMRHALAPGGGDPNGFVIGDCSTQRNLDERGRKQAREIGAAMRNAGVRFDKVLTSQWCRCRETAELLDVGPVTEAPFLNSFFADRSTEASQTTALKSHLAALDPGERVMLVTHQVNVTALTNRFISSGEVFVLSIDENGGASVVEEVLIGP